MESHLRMICNILILKDGCFANIFIVNFLTPLHCKLSNSHGRHIHPVSNAQLKEYKKIVCGNEDDMHFLFCNGACNKENETHKETFKYCKSGSESAAHKFVRTACDVLGSRDDKKIDAKKIEMHFTKKHWTKVKSIFVQIQLYFTWRSSIHHNGIDRYSGGMLLADCQYSTIGDHRGVNMRVFLRKTDRLTAMLNWYRDNWLQPKEKRNAVVITDASSTAVGGILQQEIEGEWKPMAYFSKKLQPAETHYSAFDRELLAIYLTIRHFRYFLEGRIFSVLTDHKPITYAMKNVSKNLTSRQERHMSYISEFTSDIQHIKGSDYGPADALSRTDALSRMYMCSVQRSAIDFDAMARAQPNEIRELDSTESSL